MNLCALGRQTDCIVNHRSFQYSPQIRPFTRFLRWNPQNLLWQCRRHLKLCRQCLPQCTRPPRLPHCQQWLLLSFQATSRPTYCPNRTSSSSSIFSLRCSTKTPTRPSRYRLRRLITGLRLPSPPPSAPTPAGSRRRTLTEPTKKIACTKNGCSHNTNASLRPASHISRAPCYLRAIISASILTVK